MSVNFEEREKEKTFKGKLGYDEGKSGIFSFYGYVYLDNLDVESIKEAVGQLFTMHKAIEGVFKANGYKIASDVKKLAGTSDEK